MTVQNTMGPIIMGPNDFSRVDRGITWGIKCRDIGGTQVVIVVAKQSDGSWVLDPTMESHLDDSFDLRSSAPGFNINNWLTEVLIPKLNAWLAKKFAPYTGGEVPPPQAASLFEEADLAINQLLRITVQPDNTIVASIK